MGIRVLSFILGVKGQGCDINHICLTGAKFKMSRALPLLQYMVWTHTLTHSHTHSQKISYSTHTYTHTLNLTLTHTYYTNILSHTLTHILTHSHAPYLTN